MDRDEREHFKTMNSASVRPYSVSERAAASSSALDQGSCQKLAETICGCYRRDEAQNPEIFAAALAAVLMDYPADIVRLAADPRTGVVVSFPMGLPNVGQIRAFLEDKLSHREKLQRLASLPKPDFTHRLPRRAPGAGDWANVFVAADHPKYTGFVERAKTGDLREFRYEHGRDGIFVSLNWFYAPSQEAKHFKAPSLSDDELRKLYPKKDSEGEAA